LFLNAARRSDVVNPRFDLATLRYFRQWLHWAASAEQHLASTWRSLL
jgi:hypothetical protein